MFKVRVLTEVTETFKAVVTIEIKIRSSEDVTA